MNKLSLKPNIHFTEASNTWNNEFHASSISVLAFNINFIQSMQYCRSLSKPNDWKQNILKRSLSTPPLHKNEK